MWNLWRCVLKTTLPFLFLYRFYTSPVCWGTIYCLNYLSELKMFWETNVKSNDPSLSPGVCSLLVYLVLFCCSVGAISIAWTVCLFPSVLPSSISILSRFHMPYYEYVVRIKGDTGRKVQWRIICPMCLAWQRSLSGRSRPGLFSNPKTSF